MLAGLFKVKDSYNTDVVSLRLGTVAISDQADKNACADKVKTSRKTLTTELRHRGFTVLESQGNFVLATPPTTHNAESPYLTIKQQEILVRSFKQPGLDDKLSISVGTPAHNQVLIRRLTSPIRA
ncbi:MAG: aminotransferase class I/II-fold pyridoxal phosphate-dependent enzyme [Cyanobacteria bacterium P01_H01_bin.152]